MTPSILHDANPFMHRHDGPPHRLHFGFSMVELLVVLSLVSLLMALLMPALQSSRTTANLIRSGAQLRDLQLSLHRYVADNQSKAPLVDFPHSNNINSPYYDLSGPVVYRYHHFPWSAVLWDLSYVEDWRAFWSPDRDLRASWFTGGTSLYDMLTAPNGMTGRNPSAWPAQSVNYWRMVGYGMVGVLYNDVNSLDGQIVKTNVMNVDSARFSLGNAIAMVETWSPSYQSPGQPPAAGAYWTEPWHVPSTNSNYLYNYNSRVARAYWDGHVMTSESDSIGWDCSGTGGAFDGGPYGGTWTYPWYSGVNGYKSTRPWYSDTTTYGVIDP